MKGIRKPVIFFLAMLLLGSSALAFEHEKSPVKFRDYSESTLELAKKENKPVWILFSAVWCFWCKQFAENALSDKKVIEYLNENYISVFVDADLRQDLFTVYNITALPYAAFLKPDGSVFYKYGGTLDAESFLSLLQQMKKDALTAGTEKMESAPVFSYTPPSILDRQNIRSLRTSFIDTLMENFDPVKGGVGGRRKFIMHATFTYLLEYPDKDNAKSILQSINETLKTAAVKIFDPIEGGFYRYAETRSWRIPHYEKMVDVNGAAVYLLLKVNETAKSDQLAEAAKKTTEYLSKNLYDKKTGSFLSFQVADHTYYELNAEERGKREKPEVVRKVFVDRLSVGLIYLLDALKYMDGGDFRDEVKHSVDFLAAMVRKTPNIYHLYSAEKNEWSQKGSLADHAYLSYMLAKAYGTFKNPEYITLAKKILASAGKLFYKEELGIFAENLPEKDTDIEYLMEVNSVITLAWLAEPEMKPDAAQMKAVESALTYFSGVDEFFSEKVWGAKDFRFMENYAWYLHSAELFFSLSDKKESASRTN